MRCKQDASTRHWQPSRQIKSSLNQFIVVIRKIKRYWKGKKDHRVPPCGKVTLFSLFFSLPSLVPPASSLTSTNHSSFAAFSRASLRESEREFGPFSSMLLLRKRTGFMRYVKTRIFLSPLFYIFFMHRLNTFPANTTLCELQKPQQSVGRYTSFDGQQY